MKYRQLGQGLKVSALGVGCMPMKGGSISYGQEADDESVATIHEAIDRGVTFFDTDELVALDAVAPTAGQRYPEQILKTVNL